MKIARILALPVVFLFACSSESAAPEQDPGLKDDGTGTTVDAPDSNPDGVPYPTSNVGTNARLGTKAGNRIANYKFYGFPDANAANGLQPMSLAQFYDPEGKRYKLIHIQASGKWCVFCREETEIVVPLKQKFDEMKVVWFVSLAEGDRGVPSKEADLTKWIADFKSPYPHVLDPGNKNLGVFYDAAALPWNANLNAATMEILQAGTGAHTSEEQIMTELEEWLGRIDAGELDLK